MEEKTASPSQRDDARAAARRRRTKAFDRREAIFDLFVSGFSHQQIAAALKTSSHTVRRVIDTAVAERRLDAPERFARVQVARLSKALSHADDRLERGSGAFVWCPVAAGGGLAHAHPHQQFRLWDSAAHPVKHRNRHTILDSACDPRHDGTEHDNALGSIFFNQVARRGGDLGVELGCIARTIGRRAFQHAESSDTAAQPITVDHFAINRPHASAETDEASLSTQHAGREQRASVMPTTGMASNSRAA